MARVHEWWAAWVSDEPGGRAQGMLGRQWGCGLSWLRRHPTVADALLAAAMALAAFPQLVHWARQPGDGFAERLLLSVLLVAPLAWRRRYPIATFAFAGTVAFVQWSAGISLAADIVLLVYLYTVASRYPVRVAVVAAAVLEVGALLAALRWNLTGALAQPLAERIVFLSAPVAVAFLLGAVVRARRQSRAVEADRAARRVALAAAAERARMAREMHDVVAHSIAVMVRLSDAAVVKQPSHPDEAVAAMRQVSATGRSALAETRRLLEVLRSTDGHAEARPRAESGDLAALAEVVRAAGVAVDLVVTGDVESLPVGVRLAVYRIVQESLTNSLKHARALTSSVVRVEVWRDAVVVEVTDDGVTAPREPQPAAGLGLLGIGERAAAYGGVSSAGPVEGAGWRVRARLPLGPTVAGSGAAGSDEMGPTS